MTFLEAIKEAKPGQIVKNEGWDVYFVVLLNNTLKSINSDCSSIYETSMNDTGLEIEQEVQK